MTYKVRELSGQKIKKIILKSEHAPRDGSYVFKKRPGRHKLDALNKAVSCKRQKKKTRYKGQGKGLTNYPFLSYKVRNEESYNKQVKTLVQKQWADLIIRT